MSSTNAVYVGVDIWGGQRAHCYVALNDEGRVKTAGRLRRKEMLTFLAGLDAARVALNVPAAARHWNLEPRVVGATLLPLGASETLDADLSAADIPFDLVTADENYCPVWMRRGFGFWQALESHGYQRYPAGEGTRLLVETRSPAGFAVFLGGPLYLANTLEGRMQRQMALHQSRLPVPDPMNMLEEITPHRLLSGKLPLDQILTPPELNAWLAAWTAWLTAHKPERVRCLGASQDEMLVLALPGRA